MSEHNEATIALFPWGDTWEDFFNTIGVSIEAFCEELTGGWQFGFIEGLEQNGIRAVLFYSTTLVTKPTRFVHKPTGAVVWMLPSPAIYRRIRRWMIHPYPSLGYWGEVEDLFGNVRTFNRPFFQFLKHVSSYLSMPMRFVIRELRRERCHAILCQEYEYFRFELSLLLGTMLRLPVYATFQGGTYDCNRIGRFLRPWSIRHCDGLAVGPAAEIQRLLATYRINPEKIRKIYNPVLLSMWNPIERIDARKKIGLPVDANVVIWHGRLDVHNKGMDVLIDAWRQVCRSFENGKLHLALLGSAEDAGKFRSILTSSPNQNISWIDRYVNDRKLMSDFLSAGDIFVFPSRWEGFPVAPLEAMACGLPVVAADASGVPDIFEHGEESGGIVVPRGDSAALANALCRLLADASLREAMGRAARKRVEEEFTTDSIGRQLKELFFTGSATPSQPPP